MTGAGGISMEWLLAARSILTKEPPMTTNLRQRMIEDMQVM